MTNLTTKREHENTLNKLAEAELDESVLIKAIREYYNLSQIYMNFSLLFIDVKLPHVSIILCEHALESMLRALYIKENHDLFHSRTFSIDDLTQFSFKSSVVDMDTIMLLYFTKFLSHLEDYSFIDQIQKAHLIKLIYRVDETLINLSSKIAIFTSEKYNSIQSEL
ncbi:MAG: hypothetical protein ACQEXX_30465 [Bacillota bacterium]